MNQQHCEKLYVNIINTVLHYIQRIDDCISPHTPCPEKNGTNNVLGVTLANTNI